MKTQYHAGRNGEIIVENDGDETSIYLLSNRLITLTMDDVVELQKVFAEIAYRGHGKRAA